MAFPSKGHIVFTAAEWEVYQLTYGENDRLS